MDTPQHFGKLWLPGLARMGWLESALLVLVAVPFLCQQRPWVKIL